MSKDDRVGMPMSGAGITRFFDEFKSKIQLKPMTVVVILALLLLVIVFLHVAGQSMLGLQLQ
jgi:preprotein translocase subunit Sec61beta